SGKLFLLINKKNHHRTIATKPGHAAGATCENRQQDDERLCESQNTVSPDSLTGIKDPPKSAAYSPISNNFKFSPGQFGRFSLSHEKTAYGRHALDSSSIFPFHRLTGMRHQITLSRKLLT
ncbi:hypothetical protein, partial [Pseudomonas aeruginosa]|uniref:hypothetical protein n=1 Tax=Pseudomonas aeruginosa TaxID=287 RepID=UPI0022383F72